MVARRSRQAVGSRRRVAWLALLALLLNVTVPSLALRALPPADLFATAICHAPGSEAPPGEQQQQKAPPCATCPLCTLLADQAMPVVPVAGVALPLPSAIGSITPRGPPALAMLPAEARPPGARAPPFLA